MMSKKSYWVKIEVSLAELGYKRYLFLIVPSVFFILGMQFLRSSGYYFQKCVDPEYSYLINGLLLADLHFDLPFVYHPGTPVHFITALVIRIVKLFRPGNDLLTDVLKNPETYIHATVFTINVLSSIMLVILGFYTYKKTRSIYPALFLQLIPFVHILALEPLERLVPESLMVIIVCLWSILVITIITDEHPVNRLKKYSLALGILVGLSIADKLTFAPYAVIPLFILPGWKHKLRYTVIAVFFFFVFAFPIILNFADFYNWVKNIITHTGSYGSGDIGFVHFNIFTNNIRVLINNTPVLILSVILLIYSVSVFIIKIGYTDLKHRMLCNLSFSLITVGCLQYLITAKQFSYYYMLPSILLIIPIVLLSVALNRRVFKSDIIRKIISMAAVSIFMVSLIRATPFVFSEISNLRKIHIAKNPSYLKLNESRTESSLIICSSYYGCSAVEYALIFGIHTSGKYGNYLSKKMKEIYPSTFMFFLWDNHFYEWNREISSSEFWSHENKSNLYIAEYSAKSLDIVLEALRGDRDSVEFNIMPVYVDTTSAEALFIIQKKDDHIEE